MKEIEKIKTTNKRNEKIEKVKRQNNINKKRQKIIYTPVTI